MSGHKAALIRARGPQPTVLSEAALEWVLKWGSDCGFKLPPRALTTFGKAEAAMLRGRDPRRAKRVAHLQVKLWQRANKQPVVMDDDGNVLPKFDTGYGGRAWLVRCLQEKSRGAWGHECSRSEFNKTRKL